MLNLFNAVRNALGPILFVLMAVVVTTAPSEALAREKVILAFGDSLTAGFGLAEGDSFPVQLQRALKAKGRDVRVINGGLSGDTTTGGLARLNWLLSEKPDLIIIELGANDGLRALPPQMTEQNLARLIEKARETGAEILLTGMRALPNLGRDYVEQFNGIFPRLADTYQTHFYPFFLDGVAADPALNQNDGIHPTGEGVAIIVEKILPYVEQALSPDGSES